MCFLWPLQEAPLRSDSPGDSCGSCFQAFVRISRRIEGLSEGCWSGYRTRHWGKIGVVMTKNICDASKSKRTQSKIPNSFKYNFSHFTLFMSFYVSEFGTPSPWFFPYFAPFLMAIRTNVAMVAHSLARSPRGPVQVQVLWVLRCAMADVAGAGKYHSFSGINTDKTVMDNLEAPCLGSDESTMPKDAKHICSTINLYIYYIIHCNPTYYYIYILHYPLGIFLRRGVRKMGPPLAQHCFPQNDWRSLDPRF